LTRPNIHLQIDAISCCNLRCPSCLVTYNRQAIQGPLANKAIETEFLARILDKAVGECNVAGVCLYMYSDPMLHPRLPELINCVHQRNLRCLLSSNLNILRDPHAVMNANPDWIRVSVSGFCQEIYRRGHQNGDIERVKANMMRLAQARQLTGSKCEIEVYYIRYIDNGDDERAMQDYAHSLGFKFTGSWANISPVERIMALIDRPQAVNHADRTLLARMAVPLGEALAVTAKQPSPSCWLQDNYLSMDVEGNVYLCCAVSHENGNIIGNYLDLSISEIQNRQRHHSLCSPCKKLGIPDFYKMEKPEFDDIRNCVCLRVCNANDS